MNDLDVEQWRGGARVSGAIGQGLDELHAEARRATLRAEGGKRALLELARKLEALHARADAQHEAGELDELDGLARLALVKSYVTDAIECARNLAGQRAAEATARAGAEAALGQAVTVVQRHHDVACSRVSQLEVFDGTPRPPGVKRGARSLAEARGEVDANGEPKRPSARRER